MLRFGVDYYPEQWPQDRWDTDVRLMAEAGFNVVRLAEFAWSKLEPEEGVFDFEWLDRSIALFQEKQIGVVLGTPTAAFPAWLAHKYPEVLRVREDGLRVGYGSRREYCPNNPDYRQFARRITTAMATHFAANPGVIGWQIDNEFGDRCYCPVCREAFQGWLKQRYHTLAELNDRWGTVFWSHTYSDWAHIPLPLATIGSVQNPAHALDYRRFISDSYVSFQQEQVDILRANCPRHFITHDMMGFDYEGLNYYDLAKPLDFVSWNNYPISFWHLLPYTPSLPALAHDTMRGLKRKNFWVMEQQAGPSGWDKISPTPRPGMLRLWAYQSLAHGADGLIFFRWRTARVGGEQFWHGLLEHDGRASRRYAEIKQMGSELGQVADLIAAAEFRSQVAILHSYDSRFAFQVQGNKDTFSYGRHLSHLYTALWEQGINLDVLSPDADLSGYRLVIAPALYLLGEAEAANLSAFVRSGGVLLVTARSGVKDINNALVDRPFPGLLAEVCGVIVEEYDAILAGSPQAVRFESAGLNGQTVMVDTWCDILQPEGSQVVARYVESYYAGKAAVTRHRFGKGQAVYLGAFGQPDFYEKIIRWLLEECGIRPLLEKSTGVEVTERTQGDRIIRFVLNHDDKTGWVYLPSVHRDLLTNELVSGKIQVGANDILLLSSPVG
jgi:beta-galactosidase